MVSKDELFKLSGQIRLCAMFGGYRRSGALFAIANRLSEIALSVDPVAVPVSVHSDLLARYHDLRENFMDYVCSGSVNVAPYCLNRRPECVDCYGFCKADCEYCHGFNPAEIII